MQHAPVPAGSATSGPMKQERPHQQDVATGSNTRTVLRERDAPNRIGLQNAEAMRAGDHLKSTTVDFLIVKAHA
jgi:hypothetical protein